MTILIGGFTETQYLTYIAASSGRKRQGPHPVSITVTPSLKAVTVNQVVDSLLDRSSFPNSMLLFKKFRSHVFKERMTDQEKEVAKRILTQFQTCKELDAKALEKVKEKLDKNQQIDHPFTLHGSGSGDLQPSSMDPNPLAIVLWQPEASPLTNGDIILLDEASVASLENSGLAIVPYSPDSEQKGIGTIAFQALNKTGRVIVYTTTGIVFNFSATLGLGGAGAATTATATAGVLTAGSLATAGATVTIVSATILKSLWEGKPVTTALVDGVKAPYALAKKMLTLFSRTAKVEQQQVIALPAPPNLLLQPVEEKPPQTKIDVD